MQAKISLDFLKEKAEQVIQTQSNQHLSLSHRQFITNKFANKSLQELHDMVCQLDENKLPLS